MPPEAGNYAELKKLLEENLEATKENNRLLREMRRNALIGLAVKAVIWLILLGVPLFFLGTYLGPLMNAVTGQAAGQTLPTGLFGLPSAEQMNQLIEEYQSVYQ